MSRRPSHPLARLATAPVAAALLVGLTACSATNPITTAEDYEASDGVRVELEDVTVGNLLVLSAAEGGPGVLIGRVTNSGSERATVTIAVAGTEGDAFRVAPGETVLLNPDNGLTVALDAVPAPPGAYVDLDVTSSTGGTLTKGAPVLDDTFAEYAELVPTTEG